ncbi:hypothetical protein TruAng_010611 [Truncatella angustata]|nr:hypothetical protein TruAng_010611 [Truncatella angustata]
MSALSGSILRALLETSDLEVSDQVAFKEVIGATHDISQDDELARRVLRSLIEYYETQAMLTTLDKTVLKKLLGTTTKLPAGEPIAVSEDKEAAIASSGQAEGSTIMSHINETFDGATLGNGAAESLMRGEGTVPASPKVLPVRETTVGGLHETATDCFLVASSGNGTYVPPHARGVLTVVASHPNSTSQVNPITVQHISSVTIGVNRLSPGTDETWDTKTARYGGIHLNRLSARTFEQQFVKSTTPFTTGEVMQTHLPKRWINEATISRDVLMKNYGIGSKLLLNMGWNPGSGLGSEGIGIKEPINAWDTVFNDEFVSNRTGLHLRPRGERDQPAVQDDVDKVKDDIASMHDELENGELSTIGARKAAWQKLSSDPVAHDREIREKCHTAAIEDQKNSPQKSLQLTKLELVSDRPKREPSSRLNGQANGHGDHRANKVPNSENGNDWEAQRAAFNADPCKYKCFHTTAGSP